MAATQEKVVDSLQDYGEWVRTAGSSARVVAVVPIYGTPVRFRIIYVAG
ncbi:MAG: hypothetical protein LC623_01970 [Halobacteriales archaeon]|nr:hypothetical protein [Halobacteriales archaeon]